MRKLTVLILLGATRLSFGDAISFDQMLQSITNASAQAVAPTFTLVQKRNCVVSSGAATCTLSTISPNLAAGNLDVVSCVVENNASTVPPRISTFSGGGTLRYAAASSTGSFGNSAANNRQFVYYIKPADATGFVGSPVVTLTANATFGGSCYLAEYHPSASGSLVDIDIDNAFQPAAACTSCVMNNVTLSGTSDACLVGQMGTSAFNLYPTALTSPYNTNAFFTTSGDSAGYSVASPANGNGPTWTQPSGTPQLWTTCFGFNPTAFNVQSFQDLSGGTNAATPTTATLAPGQRGYQGARLNVSQIGSLVYNSSAGMGLLNATGRMGDGSSFAAGSGSTMGLSQTGTGSTGSVSWIIWDLGNSSIQQNIIGQFKYNENLVASDTTLNDCGNIHGATDFAAANCYGSGASRFVRLETPSVNGANIPLSGGTATTWCGVSAGQGCTIRLQYNTQAAGITATTVTAAIASTTITFTGTFTASQWPVGFTFTPTGCTGGTNYNSQLFYVVTSNSTTVTASTTGFTNGGTGAVATGSATGCTLTGQDVLSLYDNAGTLQGVSFAATSTTADPPQNFAVGNGLNNVITTGKVFKWASPQLSLNLTAPPL